MTVLLPVIMAVVALYLFYRWYPPFGGRPNMARRARASRSVQYVGKKFANAIPTPMGFDGTMMRSMLRDQLRANPATRPARLLRPAFMPAAGGVGPQVTWLGHATVLVRLPDVTVLFDPIFSKTASPFPFAGPKRFAASAAIRVADLPPVDVVCISHDHYDHLDRRTVRQLAYHVRMFFVPLGVGAHLERWGVKPACITELDWWETATFEGTTFVCTPSRHFSGRTLADRFKTLWCSWVVRDDATNVYFSGDTGYGPHFARIGKKYGPFDLAMLECGQYDYRWPNIHMQPEQTAAAFVDLRGKRLLPIHWGAFKLAFHGWSEPVERLLSAVRKIQPHAQVLLTPAIGQTVVIGGKISPAEPWWQAYEAPTH